MDAPQIAAGQTVTVRLYGGKLAKRRVVKEKARIVVICSEDEYQAALAEHREPEGVGFPRQDIVELAESRSGETR